MKSSGEAAQAFQAIDFIAFSQSAEAGADLCCNCAADVRADLQSWAGKTA